jgi:LPS export ABC transporter protein LptC
MKHASRAKFLLVLVILALVGVSAVYLAGTPGPKKPKTPIKEVKVDQSEVVIDGFRYAKNDSDSAENWQLTAKTAHMKKDTGLANLQDLEAVWGGKDGMVLTMTADQGFFDSGTKGIKVLGKDRDVLIRSNNGYTMTARDLSWDSKRRELTTPGNVVLFGKDVKIEGKGLVARSDLQEVRITNGVRTEFSQSK